MLETKYSNKNYLIVGSSGVSSNSIIKAIEENHQEEGSPFYITASSSGSRPGHFAHHCLENIDLSHRDAVQSIIEGVNGKKIDTLFFTPARGAVGIPIHRVSEAEIKASLEFSLYPFCQLIRELKPKVAVALSGYIWLETIAICYGAMFYPKVILELLAENNRQKIKVVRLGFFPSHSSRAVFIITQRALQNNSYPQEYNALKQRWKESKKKFYDYFAELTFSLEKEAFSARFSTPYRPTEPDDIKRGIKRLLGGTESPIINIVGDWYWEEQQAYNRWPNDRSDVYAKAKAIYTDIVRKQILPEN